MYKYTQKTRVSPANPFSIVNCLKFACAGDEIAPLACAFIGGADRRSRPDRRCGCCMTGADPRHKVGEEEVVLHPPLV